MSDSVRFGVIICKTCGGFGQVFDSVSVDWADGKITSITPKRVRRVQASRFRLPKR